MSDLLKGLSPEQRQELIERVAERVRAKMQKELVPPNPEVHGTWQETGGLRALQGAGASRFGTAGDPSKTPKDFARYIDHTMLKPTTTRADIVRVCNEARQFGFASVCVNTTWISLARQLLVTKSL